MDFDIGVPLLKSHIHNIFEPVNVIGVDNGQTEEKGNATNVTCANSFLLEVGPSSAAD